METTAKIYKERSYYRVVLNTGSTKLINADEICFDKKKLIIRHPTIYDNKVYRIATKKTINASFVFSFDCEPTEDITGKYLVEKDGDEYYFLKNEKEK